MASKSWNPGSEGLASNPNNWSPTGAPKAGDVLFYYGGTINIQGDDLRGNTLTFSARGSEMPTGMMNLSNNANVRILVAKPYASETISVNGHDTLDFNSASLPVQLTINIDPFSVLTSTIDAYNGVTVSGNNQAKFENKQLSAKFATIDADVIGVGAFLVEPGAQTNGSLTFLKSVGSGQVVTVRGNTSWQGATPTSLVLRDFKDFKAQVIQTPFSLVDLGQVLADSYTEANGVITLFSSGKVVGTLQDHTAVVDHYNGPGALTIEQVGSDVHIGNLVYGRGTQLTVNLLDGQVFSAVGAATINAGLGNTIVYGSSGTTVVIGGAGHLDFVAGSGASTVTGGSGSSTVFGGAGGGRYDGGSAGHNLLEAGGGAVTIHAGGAGDILVAGTGPTLMFMQPDNVAFGNTGAATINGASDGTLVGGSGDTLLVAASGAERLFAGGGNTTLKGGSDASILASSNTGHTTMYGGTGNNTLVGYGNEVTAIGGSGNETYFAGTGTMNITEGTGNDQIVFGRGNAQVQIGSGENDLVFVNGAAGGTAIINSFKVGPDRIALYGYKEEPKISTLGGRDTSLSLSDGTTVLFTNVLLGKSSILSA